MMQEVIKNNWLEYMESFGLYQVINVQTRVTDPSATLIDHIYTYNKCNNLMTEVLKLGLSDHFPVFLS